MGLASAASLTRDEMGLENGEFYALLVRDGPDTVASTVVLIEKTAES